MLNRDETLDIKDILLDDENNEQIVLVDEQGKKLAFEQIAVVPYDEKIYCVLKPVDRIDGIEDDEAIVFYVDEGKDENDVPVLCVETDELKAMDVFAEYYNLLDTDTE